MLNWKLFPRGGDEHHERTCCLQLADQPQSDPVGFSEAVNDELFGGKTTCLALCLSSWGYENNDSWKDLFDLVLL